VLELLAPLEPWAAEPTLNAGEPAVAFVFCAEILTPGAGVVAAGDAVDAVDVLADAGVEPSVPLEFVESEDGIAVPAAALAASAAIESATTSAGFPTALDALAECVFARAFRAGPATWFGSADSDAALAAAEPSASATD
jgi:ABC-type xylose transport system permease subunit